MNFLLMKMMIMLHKKLFLGRLGKTGYSFFSGLAVSVNQYLCSRMLGESDTAVLYMYYCLAAGQIFS